VAISLKTGNGGKDGFQPTDLLGSGQKGLHKAMGAASTVRLFGSGLTNRLDVEVRNPSYLWTGATSGSTGGGAQCLVVLRQRLRVIRGAKKKRGKKTRDDDITVSVTVTDTSTGTTSNTIRPTVPAGP
jgi:hypothetical protein